jgi:hypothetical protein
MLFHIEDDLLTVKFQGVEQFWAVKRKLLIPKVNITNTIWHDAVQISRREFGWRIGGSALPGVLMAGRFMGHEGRNFVYVQHPQGWTGDIQLKHVLEIELKDYPYHRLFFTVDKPDIAEGIIGWWSSNI